MMSRLIFEIRSRLAWLVAPMGMRMAIKAGSQPLSIQIAASRLIAADKQGDISSVDQALTQLRDLGVHVEKLEESRE